MTDNADPKTDINAAFEAMQDICGEEWTKETMERNEQFREEMKIFRSGEWKKD